MGELCKHLNITRQTLSRYKHRNYVWREAIEEIKSDISFWNFLVKVNGFPLVAYSFIEQRTMNNEVDTIE